MKSPFLRALQNKFSRRRAAPASLFLLPDLRLNFALADLRGRVFWRDSVVGHSWVRNAYNGNFAAIAGSQGCGNNAFGAGYMTGKNQDGAVRYSASGSAYLGTGNIPSSTGLVPNTTGSDRGIIIGSGDTAFDIDNHDLDALISNGTGSGQMSYAAQSRGVLSYASKIWTILHSRNFSNYSGALITVKEIGLMTYNYYFGANGNYLLARDVIDTPIDVADSTVLTVEYEISSSFAGID